VSAPHSAREATRLLLRSPDLMIASRLAGTPGVEVTTDPGAGPFAAVIVDLSAAGSAGDLVGAARRLAADQAVAGAGTAVVVAFGPHVARERLAEAAAAGADHVVSRGELLGTLPALLVAWLRGPDPLNPPATGSTTG
jgi:hypothetical protein